MGLVLDWKASLGYRHDPFDPSLRAVSLEGLDDLKERFNLWLIKGGSLGTIAGDKGTGKTAFLRWIETELAPKRSHQQHYLDAKAGASADDLRKALGTRQGIIGKFLPGKTKDDQELLARLAKQQTVLLIDNAGGLHKDALALLGQLLDKTPLHTVLADTHERLAKLDLPVKDGLGLRIGKYRTEDLGSILATRILAAGVADCHPFDVQERKRLCSDAEGNPAQLLRLARERAIELSLKSGKGTAATPAPATTPSSGKKKLISIRLAKTNAKEPTKADPAAPAPSAATSEMIDAAGLNEIIAETAGHSSESVRKPEAKRPVLTTQELKIFDELSRKETKRPATKKAPAKKGRRS